MRALSTSIVLMVTVIVVLIVALVVLSIFSGGIGQINTITNFKNNCITQCQITCKMGALPPTWDAMVKVQGVTGETSCAIETGVKNKKCESVCGAGTCTGTPPTCTGDTGCKECGNTGSKYCGFC